MDTPKVENKTPSEGGRQQEQDKEQTFVRILTKVLTQKKNLQKTQVYHTTQYTK